MNYEYAIGEHTTLGATYMKWLADAALKPERDGLNVFNVRAYTAPLEGIPDLSFEFEYASERNGEALDSDAWTAQGSYELSDVSWTPKFTYRYAFFQGDDPETTNNEAFDPLFVGFYDWGYWWQGEIAGEYFLSNSNLKSHLVRGGGHAERCGRRRPPVLQVQSRPAAGGRPEVTDKDVAFEIDAYVDWKVNANFTVSVLGAFADPGKAVQQSSGRTKNFAYGMVYVGYSF